MRGTSKSNAALRQYFQARGQQACGTRGAAEKMAWMRKLRLQRSRNRSFFVCDERNGFNCLRRAAIKRGLLKLPASCQWLTQAFVKFYRGASKLMYAHGEGLDDDLLVECSKGVHQGDGAGMVYFAAGMDDALMQLRSEFPDAKIEAFADDVAGDTGIDERVAATDEHVSTCTPPTLDKAELAEDGTMPAAAAIIVRWSHLAQDLTSAM